MEIVRSSDTSIRRTFVSFRIVLVFGHNGIDGFARASIRLPFFVGLHIGLNAYGLGRQMSHVILVRSVCLVKLNHINLANCDLYSGMENNKIRFWDQLARIGI